MECGSYVEEKVGQSESPDFLRHLATCPGCQRDVEEMDDVRSLYRSASVERYAGGVPRVRRAGWASRLPAAVAAVAMIAALVFVLGHRAAPPASHVTADATVPFYRIRIEPWRSDVRFDHAVNDCWHQLDTLERSR